MHGAAEKLRVFHEIIAHKSFPAERTYSKFSRANLSISRLQNQAICGNFIAYSDYSVTGLVNLAAWEPCTLSSACNDSDVNSACTACSGYSDFNGWSRP